MSADIKRLQAQQEAQAMELQRLKMQNQTRQHYTPRPDEEYEVVEPVHQPQNEYNSVDAQQAMIEAITQRVTNQVTQQVNAQHNAQKGVDNRMERLVKKYPGIRDDEDPLTKRARDEYQRISIENPGLLQTDKGAAYELAVETAAAALSIRPQNQEYNPMQDYTLSAGGSSMNSPKRKSGMNFLTPKILANFEILAKNHPDFNMDPSTPQGKKNLEELNEYSERFKGNQDEDHLRWK